MWIWAEMMYLLLRARNPRGINIGAAFENVLQPIGAGVFQVRRKPECAGLRGRRPDVYIAECPHQNKTAKDSDRAKSVIRSLLISDPSMSLLLSKR